MIFVYRIRQHNVYNTLGYVTRLCHRVAKIKTKQATVSLFKTIVYLLKGKAVPLGNKFCFAFFNAQMYLQLWVIF